MEAKLSELVKRLRDATGDNLAAVVLYGSAVTEEFLEKHSDLNILCIVSRVGSAELEQMHAAAEWWIRQGNPAPLLFTFDELARSADVFSIELMDMKSRHRMLFGEDFLEKFEVPLRLHRLQVERELRINWLRLRQAVLGAPRRKKAHLALMLDSVSTFCALFRHALLAIGQPGVETRREAVSAFAALTGADPLGFNAILDFRDGKQSRGQIDIEAVMHAYLEFVEVVTNDVDRRLSTS
jgi:predicted nucleotidyltransferase